MAKKNISPFVAIMVFFDRVKRNLSYLDETTIILSTSRNYLLTLSGESNLQVAKYYEINNKTWLRSEKVTGKRLDVRHKEHHHKAKYNSYQSEIDSRYLSSESK